MRNLIYEYSSYSFIFACEQLPLHGICWEQFVSILVGYVILFLRTIQSGYNVILSPQLTFEKLLKIIELLGMFIWSKEVIFGVSENATFFKLGFEEEGMTEKILKTNHTSLLGYCSDKRMTEWGVQFRGL